MGVAPAANGSKERIGEWGQKFSDIKYRVVNNDTLTTTLTSLDPYRGLGSKEWVSKPVWVKPAAIGAALTTLGSGIFLICKSKWLEKPLWLRRTTGALLVLPLLYFGGYAVYTLFRKGTEANNNRLEKKAKAEFEKQKAAEALALAKEQTAFEKKYSELLEAISAKPAAEQYDEIVKLAGADTLELKWVVEGEDNFVELKGQAHTCRKAIANALYDVMVENGVANEFGAIAEVLMDENAEPESVKATFRGVRVSLQEKYGIEKKGIKLEEQGRIYSDLCFSVTRNDTKIHSQKISPSAATAIFKKLPGYMDGYQSDLAESMAPAKQDELEEVTV